MCDQTEPITAFRDDYEFLSNFYPHEITADGEAYPTAEHAFQALKTDDPVERATIRTAPMPAVAKQRGKKVTLRENWDTVRFEVMERVLRIKFADPELAARLAATGDRELIEGNTWRDATWGMIKGKDGTWKGSNELGKLLMRLRSEIRTAMASETPQEAVTDGKTLPSRPVINPRTRTGEEANQTDVFLPSRLGSFPTDAGSVTLYDGPMGLRSVDMLIQGEGQVVMEFSPQVSLRFALETDAVPFGLPLGDDRNAPKALELVAPGRTVTAHPTSSSVSTSGKDWVRGRIVGESAQFTMLKPDGKPESVGRVRFHLLNFREYLGDSLCGPTSLCGGLYWGGRVRAEFGGWILTLDTLPDGQERRDRLEERGGCLVTHLGDVRRGDNKLFAPAEAEEVIDFLYWLLSFANGARCGCVLAAGLRHLDHPLWEQWKPYKTHAGRPGSSWFPAHFPEEGLGIAENAWSLWRNTEKRAWFTRAIALYTDCNRNTSGTEIELAKAQIALEMLTWVVLREEQTVISEEGLEKLQAADRLRLLLSWCRIPLAVPESLKGLSAAFQGAHGCDGPLAVTEIRNCAIHPTQRNLKKLNGYDHDIRFEAWWLSLWYIELVILNLFNYNGRHNNRLDLGGWEGKFEKVPWAA